MYKEKFRFYCIFCYLIFASNIFASQDLNFDRLALNLISSLHAVPIDNLSQDHIVPTEGQIRNSIFEVKTENLIKSQLDPLTYGERHAFTGTAFLVSNRHIITCFHVVEGAKILYLLRKDLPRKEFQATVVASNPNTDIAILEVEDESFYDNLYEFDLAEDLAEGISVVHYGFPQATGGNMELSFGRIAAYDFFPTGILGKANIVATTSASIKKGFSGGPTIKDDRNPKVYGMSIKFTEKMAIIVPSTILRNFITQYENGLDTNPPEFGVQIQNLDSVQLRKRYGLSLAPDTGILVNSIDSKSIQEHLKVGDIIKSIDNHQIDCMGELKIDGSMINILGYIAMKKIGDTINLTIIRENTELEVTIELNEADEEAVSLIENFNRPISYFIWGGFVFLKKTASYIHSLENLILKEGEDRLFKSRGDINLFAFKILGQLIATDNSSKVVLKHVLPHRINEGFHALKDIFVDEIRLISNHKIVEKFPIESLECLIHVLEREDINQFDMVEFLAHTKKVIALDISEVLEFNSDILAAYDLRHNRSIDLENND